MPRRFHWIAFDVGGSLPPGWEHEIRAVAEAADFRKFPRTPVLSREAPDVRSIPRGRVHADQVGLRLPWLKQSYRGAFLALARQVCAEPVMAARDNRYGIVLNVQRGTTMRFECHIDSNPLTGLLFCTDHRAGGELVIATLTPTGYLEISRATLIKPTTPPENRRELVNVNVVIGQGDLWVAECVFSEGGKQVIVVSVLEFSAGQIVR